MLETTSTFVRRGVCRPTARDLGDRQNPGFILADALPSLCRDWRTSGHPPPFVECSSDNLGSRQRREWEETAERGLR